MKEVISIDIDISDSVYISGLCGSSRSASGSTSKSSNCSERKHELNTEEFKDDWDTNKELG